MSQGLSQITGVETFGRQTIWVTDVWAIMVGQHNVGATDIWETFWVKRWLGTTYIGYI